MTSRRSIRSRVTSAHAGTTLSASRQTTRRGLGIAGNLCQFALAGASWLRREVHLAQDGLKARIATKTVPWRPRFHVDHQRRALGQSFLQPVEGAIEIAEFSVDRRHDGRI